MTEWEQAVLEATAEDVSKTDPALAALLADGPELLRMRGVSPAVLDKLVPGSQPSTWRARLRRFLEPEGPRRLSPDPFP